MKATGIVRRIDDLGRVVIPKEIRRTMRIREGDPLEIYTDREGGVIFKKYSQLGDVSDFAAQLCDTISRVAGLPAVITDRDSVIAGGGVTRRGRAGLRGLRQRRGRPRPGRCGAEAGPDGGRLSGPPHGGLSCCAPLRYKPGRGVFLP